MSINVTVHGNPISINRGKMVALDNNKEFELRRKIRIQQVRQQSKRIAEEVRNKVRREKNKQLNKFGKEAEDDYRHKQNRKLTCLKQYYRGCLADFGKAFGDAENEPDENEIISQINKNNRCQAEERGRIAEHKYENDKEKEIHDSQKHIANKKYARYIEDLRSKLVTDLSKEKKSKKKGKRQGAVIVINGKVQDSGECVSNSDLFRSTSDEDDEDTECELSDESEEMNNETNKESVSEESKNIDLNDERNERSFQKIPVCPTTSKNNTTYNSHENYRNKICSLKNKSHDSLAHVVDSIDKTVVSADDFEVSCFDAPFKNDLENIVDSVSRDLDQQIEKSYVSDYKDSTKQTTNKPVYFKPVSPTKPKIAKMQLISSPDRRFIRKTLTSQNSSPRISNKDKDQECLNIVSPIKVTRKVFKKGPKKLSRRKSSLHDTNYCSPTFIKTFKKNSCETSRIQKNVDHDEQISPKHILTHQLPKVPKTIIRPDAEIPTKQTNVTCYDRFNRYSKEEPQSAVVKKISKESVDIISDHEDSDIEIKDMMCKKRDKDAKLRGNRALEKVKIHQDYHKLLQELPILQRQERLANMPMHKPTLHMSDERYQEYERKKQNAIDNKFENMQSKAILFERPPVTLKSIRKPPVCPGTTAPLKTLDITDENAVNVGSWEKAGSISSERHLSSAEQSLHDTSSEAAIADLLKRVNKQRELLIKEAVNMKSLRPLKDILNKDELINVICNHPPGSKLLIETGTSPINHKTIRSSSSKHKSVTKSPKRSATSSSDTSIESKPKSKPSKIKPKVKKLKVILREEATQTSPLITKTEKIELTSKEVTVKEDDQNSIATHSSKSRKTKTTCKTSKKASIKKSQLTEKTVARTTSAESSTENSNKFCEIIIRTGDQNVKINPLTGETTCEPKVKKGSPKKDMLVKIKEMNGLEVSTSTSYLSPPTELKSKEKLLESTHNKNSIEITRPSNKHLLQPQKQQTNLDNLVRTENGKKQINPRLVKYILRLLNMSRQSIDDLTISSVSDVSTPQDSLINSTNNIAKDKLQTVMEHFNLSPEDIKKLCSSSSSFSDVNAELKKHVEEQQKQILKPASKPCYPSSPKEEGRDLREDVKDVYLSTSSNYEDSKSKISTSHKPLSHICSETQDSSTITQESKETSTEVQSSSRSSKATSPKYESKKRSPKSSPKSPTKVAVPKVDSISEPFSTLSSSIQQSNLQLKPNTSPKKQVVPKCPTTVTTSSDEIMLKDSKKFLLFVRESLGMTQEEFTDLGFEEMFSRHLELTEYCHDRIRSLMSLIEQIRNEKREICTSASPVDPSMTLTSYLELPPSKAKQNKEYDVNVKNSLESDISSSTSISQEAIDRYLLVIGSDEELIKKKKELSSSHNSTLEKRLKSGESKDETDKQSFIPMLQGIPKYSDSKSATSHFLGELLQDMKPKPPPALLRSNMRGHTNEIPHELSTIVEADTLISSRNTSMQRARSPEERIPSKHSSPRKICISPKEDTKSHKQDSDSPKLIIRSPNKNDKPIDISSPTNSSAAYVTISPERSSGSKQQKGKSSTSESADHTKSGISGIHSLSETSESEEIEMLLRKYKMEWAISLVKKSEQALALSSSSSSSEIRGKKDVSSDISVRESFREMCKKLASMNESDIERAQIVSDLSQHFREFHEISGIGAAGDSKNRSQQRTSTPVQHSKSPDSKRSVTNDSLFKVDSELSSVKNSSDENYNQLFLSIPNVTLNTEHISLIK